MFHWATQIKEDMKYSAELLNARKYKTTLPSKINLSSDQERTRNKLSDTQREEK